MNRAALYLRVSTREQRTDAQEAELRSWASRLGLEVGRGVRRHGERRAG
jgi:DNA invertase Pin-like site-specific DNA recombinase